MNHGIDGGHGKGRNGAGPIRMKSKAGSGAEVRREGTTKFTKDTKKAIGVSHDHLEVAGACARARSLADIVHDGIY